MKILINEEQLNQLILLTESVSDVVYHYTNAHNLLSILKTNKINLAPSYGIGADQALNYNKLYSLSLTTARNSATGYYSSGKNPQNAEGKVRLEMNGRELNYNYKSKHVDYWQYPRTKELTQNGGSYDEMEERILSDKNVISPANRYISAIEIYIDENLIKIYHEIENLANSLDIPCYFYNNGKDFNFSLKKNAVKLTDTYGNSNEYYSNYTDEELKQESLMNITGLASIVAYKDENIKNKILQYANENGFDVNKVNEIIDERIKTIHYDYLSRPDKYFIRQLESLIGSEISRNRSTTDEFVRYLIKLLGYDMKSRGLKTIKEYIWYKAYIGKKTQKQFNEQFYKKILTVIDSKYKEYIDDLNDRSFIDIDGEYYDGNVIKMVPEVKTQLDAVISKIKSYYKDKILSNDDMFRYSFYYTYTEVKDRLSLEDINYEFANDTIDYNESNLDKYNIKNVILYTLHDTANFAYDEIKSMQDEYREQLNRS